MSTTFKLVIFLGKTGFFWCQVVLAEGLANLIVGNLTAMHQQKEAALVSEWRPGRGQGTTVVTSDLSMAIMALANYARHIHTEPKNVESAKQLLKTQADFLVSVLQSTDGSVADAFDFAVRAPLSGPRTLLAQGFAVRGLIEAFKELKDPRYLKAAQNVYAFMNASLWDEQVGVYRSHVGAAVTEYTPLNLGAALGAMREIILATKNASELERYKRFWVQGVDASGIQQSEYEETGEKDFFARDGDGDGINRIEYADGKYGIAPVFASRVEIQTPLNQARK